MTTIHPFIKYTHLLDTQSVHHLTHSSNIKHINNYTQNSTHWLNCNFTLHTHNPFLLISITYSKEMLHTHWTLLTCNIYTTHSPTHYSTHYSTISSNIHTYQTHNKHIIWHTTVIPHTLTVAHITVHTDWTATPHHTYITNSYLYHLTYNITHIPNTIDIVQYCMSNHVSHCIAMSYYGHDLSYI